MAELDMTEVLEVVSRRAWERMREERGPRQAPMPAWEDASAYQKAQFREHVMGSDLVDITARVVAEMLAPRTESADDLFELAMLPSGSVVRPAGDEGVAEVVDDEKNGLALRRGAQRIPLAVLPSTMFPMSVLVTP